MSSISRVLEDDSNDNLNFLAKELAINYYNSSIPLTSSSNVLQEGIFNSEIFKRYSKPVNRYKFLKPTDLQKNVFAETYETNELNDRDFKDYSPKNVSTRNILIIGAGASNTYYKDIPLGYDAIKKVYKKFIVHTFNKRGKSPITFWDILNFSVINPKKPSYKNEEIEKNIFLKEIAGRLAEEYSKLKLYASNPLENNTNKIDFEIALVLLSRFITNEKLRDELRNLFDARHGPTLFYNLVAHLLKHRIIDVVINLNFDELLDQCIRDRIGDENYITVINGGDCEKIGKWIKGSRDDNGHDIEKLAYPLYIKPHGSISDRHSMRFTKDHYYEIPKEIHLLIDSLIGSNYSGEEEIPQKRINLINVGFNMESLEINSILRNSLLDKSNVFWFLNNPLDNEDKLIDKYKSKIDIFFSKVLSEEDAKKREIKLHLIGSNFPVASKNPLYPDSPNLGKIFYQLFSNIQNLFNKEFRPVDIHKYLLEEGLFGNKIFLEDVLQKYNKKKNHFHYPRDYFDSSDYYRDRVVFELIISSIKSNGKLDPKKIMKTNVGHYYSKYHDKKLHEEIYDKSKVIAYTDFLKLFPLSEVHNSKTEIDQPFTIYETKHRDFDQLLDHLFSKNKEKTYLEEYVSPEFFESFRRSVIHHYTDKGTKRSYVNSFFEALSDGNKSEIVSDYKGAELHIFKNFRKSDLLLTDLSIAYCFHKMINKDINTIYLIAERGHYLKRFFHLFKDRSDITLHVILANNHIIEEKKTGQKIWVNKNLKSKNNPSKIFYTTSEKKQEHSLEWHVRKRLDIPLSYKNLKLNFLEINAHNHHMAIFTKVDEAGEIIDGFESLGIYYYQPGKSYQINPVKITEPENITYLKDKFEQYWKRASIYTDRK